MGRARGDVAQENQGNELGRGRSGSPGHAAGWTPRRTGPDRTGLYLLSASRAGLPHPPPGREPSHRGASGPLRLRTVATLGVVFWRHRKVWEARLSEPRDLFRSRETWA